jgi:hypothetical protein
VWTYPRWILFSLLKTLVRNVMYLGTGIYIVSSLLNPAMFGGGWVAKLRGMGG